jgi:shikimate kinase
MAVVVFLGVKHCGKSTQAALLAQKLNALLLDSDELLKTKYASEYSVGIEKAAPRAIMQRHGEDFFRRFEAGVIREFLKNKPEKPCVLALGGGVADNAFLTVGELKELGFLIFLKIDPEIAYKRIVAGGLPPFLQSVRAPLRRRWARGCRRSPKGYGGTAYTEGRAFGARRCRYGPRQSGRHAPYRRRRY